MSASYERFRLKKINKTLFILDFCLYLSETYGILEKRRVERTSRKDTGGGRWGRWMQWNPRVIIDVAVSIST